MIICYIDGACAPTNPGGYIGIGIYIEKDGKPFAKYSQFIEKSPDNSNNVAEYWALIWALKWLNALIEEDEIIIKGDSKLVMLQMCGEWKINGGAYEKYAKMAMGLMQKKITFQWIPRLQNKIADDLSKIGFVERNINTEFFKK